MKNWLSKPEKNENMNEFYERMNRCKELKAQWAKEVNPNLPPVNLPQPKKKTKKKKPLKKRGRKRVKRRFDETRLGYFLRLHAPLEYDMIMASTGGDEPDADFIESFSYSSMNPFFRGDLFRSALIQYRTMGCYQGKKGPPSPRRIANVMQKRIKAVCEHYRSQK